MIDLGKASVATKATKIFGSEPVPPTVKLEQTCD